MAFRVAIVGDSAMWGQGLLPEHQYARLAAERIAAAHDEPLEVLPGLGEESQRGYARSGAKISADVREGDLKEILLPNGASMFAPPGDRANFALTFRSLFETNTEMRDFLAGRNDRPAARLYGDHPATFPTVTGQVRALVEDEHLADVRLVILDGGINDVDFEEILDPTGPSSESIDKAIQAVFRVRLSGLLGTTRAAFPSAVIVVAGYFAAISNDSDRGELKDLFEFMSKKPEWQIALNGVISQLPLLGDLTNALGLSKDVDALVASAVRRTVAAAALAHYWTRVTVASQPAAVKRPGLVYAHPAWLREHALFAGDRSLVHSGYLPPGHGRRSVSDELRERRLARIPLHDRLGLYKSARGAAAAGKRVLEDPSPPGSVNADDQVLDLLNTRLQQLRDAGPDLPSQILLALRDLDLERPETLVPLEFALNGEIGRIEIATIASFIHPNRAGDERYANRIVAAYNRQQQFSVKRALRGIAPTGLFSVRNALRQHGVDPKRGLRQLTALTDIESVAVRLIGLPPLAGAFGGATRKTTIRLGQGFQLSVALPVFRGGTDPLLAFDTGAEVPLANVTEFSLIDPPDFTEIALEFNGHKFLRRRRDQARVAGKTFTFPFAA